MSCNTFALVITGSSTFAGVSLLLQKVFTSVAIGLFVMWAAPGSSQPSLFPLAIRLVDRLLGKSIKYEHDFW